MLKGCGDVLYSRLGSCGPEKLDIKAGKVVYAFAIFVEVCLRRAHENQELLYS